MGRCRRSWGWCLRRAAPSPWYAVQLELAHVEELGISLPTAADVHTDTIHGGGVDGLDGGEILRERWKFLRVGATQLFATGA